jgi:hypothetical protein
MNLFRWLFGGRSARSVALAFYKRGLRCTKKHDQHGAMECFTAAVESPGAPNDVRAMALYNRALLFTADDDFSAAVDDLNAVLAMPDPLRDIKLAVRRRLDRMQHQRSVAGSIAAHASKPRGLEPNVAV